MSSDTFYFIIGAPMDVYEYAFFDIIRFQNVSYLPSYSNRYYVNIISILRRIFSSLKCVSKLKCHYCLKKIAYIYEKKAYEYGKICFVLMSGCISWEQFDFSKHLKKTFSNCSILYYFGDLVSKDNKRVQLIENKKSEIDYICTYDRTDAFNYNLNYIRMPYSKMSIITEKKEIDILFVGQAKDRLEDIYDAFKYFYLELNLNCEFYIIGAPKNRKVFEDRIHFTKWMQYRDYLDLVSKTRAILDISQKSATGASLRVYEAIVYDKILISNQETIKRETFYNPKYMHVYRNLHEISKEYILNDKVKYGTEEKKYCSPVHFLRDIDELLRKGKHSG